MTVTRWTHPDELTQLILPGTPEETREDAGQHFSGNLMLLEGKQEEMSEEAFAALPEFEG